MKLCVDQKITHSPALLRRPRTLSSFAEGRACRLHNRSERWIRQHGDGITLWNDAVMVRTRATPAPDPFALLGAPARKKPAGRLTPEWPN